MAKGASKGAKKKTPAKLKSSGGSNGSTGSSRNRSGGGNRAAEALFKLLQSPLAAELLTVGATAAVAALAEHRYSKSTGGAGAKRALKGAVTAAAAAMGRRIARELDDIKKSAKSKASKAA